NAGSWFHHRYAHLKIPTLEDIFKKATHYPTLLNIELKNVLIHYDGLEKKVIQLIKKYQLQRQVILSSFNPKSIKLISSIDRQITSGFLYFGRLDEPWVMATELGARVIHPPIDRLTNDFVKKSHNH